MGESCGGGRDLNHIRMWVRVASDLIGRLGSCRSRATAKLDLKSPPTLSPSHPDTPTWHRPNQLPRNRPRLKRTLFPTTISTTRSHLEAAEVEGEVAGGVVPGVVEEVATLDPVLSEPKT